MSQGTFSPYGICILGVDTHVWCQVHETPIDSSCLWYIQQCYAANVGLYRSVIYDISLTVFISLSDMILIVSFRTLRDLKSWPANRCLSSLHCISMGLSCGVYDGRKTGTMSPWVDSMNLLTSFDLRYEALYSTIASLRYIFCISFRKSMNVSVFSESTMDIMVGFVACGAKHLDCSL